MIVDAHQHFWRLARGDYRFPSPEDPVLYRDFGARDLAPILAASGIGATVLVQATDTLAETGFLLQVAAETPFVAGVVGWCDPRDPDLLDRLLDLPGRQKLVGVRPMLQIWDEVPWLLEPQALAGLERIAAAGLVFDALVDARHLGTISALCCALPALRVVIDHMGKPWRHPALFDRWLIHMAELAETPGCRVKVSGFPFASESDDEHSHAGRLVARLRAWFGAGRLLWGSDWPVVERQGGYGHALTRMQGLFSAQERPAVFAGNAVELYRLDRAVPAGQARARETG